MNKLATLGGDAFGMFFCFEYKICLFSEFESFFEDLKCEVKLFGQRWS